MEIRINKEILSYTESIFFGLSFRQFIYSLLACIVAVVIYFVSIDKLGIETTSWLCMLGAAPFAAIGFIQFQSMSLERIIIEYIRSSLLKHRDLINQPINFYYELIKPIVENSKKENLKYVKKFSKIQTRE